MFLIGQTLAWSSRGQIVGHKDVQQIGEKEANFQQAPTSVRSHPFCKGFGVVFVATATVGWETGGR